jgi:hypothetical protein
MDWPRICRTEHRTLAGGRIRVATVVCATVAGAGIAGGAMAGLIFSGALHVGDTATARIARP